MATLYWSCGGQEVTKRSWEGCHEKEYILGMCLSFYRTQNALLQAKLHLSKVAQESVTFA